MFVKDNNDVFVKDNNDVIFKDNNEGFFKDNNDRLKFSPQDEMASAMEDYPDTCAVLVRRHGVYVWGDTWEKAKTM